MSIYFDQKRFNEFKFEKEKDFEEYIYANASALFGESTILIDVKKKIDSGELGRAIPDGFLFDFSDPEDPKFFLIEVELQSHDFYKHIFPQITKFFAFLKSESAEQLKLVDSLYRIIESTPEYKQGFIKALKGKELFKFLKDIVEDSVDILLIIDGKKPEIEEIKQTYTETWGKYVKLMECHIYKNGIESIIHCDPDYEVVDTDPSATEWETSEDDSADKQSPYNEQYHLSDTDDQVRAIYFKIKEAFPNLPFNFQKYYISIRSNSNFAYIKVRKKLVRIHVLVPISEAKKLIKSYHFKEPSASVLRFYNGQCTDIKVDSANNIEEVVAILKLAENYEIKRVR